MDSSRGWFLVGQLMDSENSYATGPARVNHNVVRELGLLGYEVKTLPRNLSRLAKAVALAGMLSHSSAGLVSGVGLNTALSVLACRLIPWFPRVAYVAHGVASIEVRLGYNYSRLMLWQEKMLMHLAHRVITVSEISRKMILEEHSLPPRKVVVIPNGVELRFLQQKKEFIDRRPIRVLFVGVTRHVKGLDFLLEALQGLSTEDFQLRIVGGQGDAEERLRGLLGQVNCCRLGKLDQPALMKEYLEADVFVLPSRYETFGLVALEAMAVGVPVIVTAQAGVSELTESGVESYHVKFGDVQTLRNILQCMVRDTQARRLIGELGKRKAAQWTWARVAQLYAHHLGEISS